MKKIAHPERDVVHKVKVEKMEVGVLTACGFIIPESPKHPIVEDDEEITCDMCKRSIES